MNNAPIGFESPEVAVAQLTRDLHPDFGFTIERVRRAGRWWGRIEHESATWHVMCWVGDAHEMEQFDTLDGAMEWLRLQDRRYRGPTLGERPLVIRGPGGDYTSALHESDVRPDLSPVESEAR